MTKSIPTALAMAILTAHPGYSGVTSDPFSYRPRVDASVVYTWSDSSASVRLPRTLLTELNLHSIEIVDDDAVKLAIPEEFVTLCAITPLEKAGVISAVTNALHVYRSTQAQRWAVSAEQADLSRWGANPLERYDFTREPILEERTLIYQAAQQQILSLLGPQRAALFWDLGECLYLDNRGMGVGFTPSPGVTPRRIYTFLLRKAETGLEVELWETIRRSRPVPHPGSLAAPVPAGNAEALRADLPVRRCGRPLPTQPWAILFWFRFRSRSVSRRLPLHATLPMTRC